MHRVVIRSNAAYRAVEDHYIEVCTACHLSRSGKASACSCGASFAPQPKKFFMLKRSLPSIAPLFPSHCPHCARAGTKETTLSRALHTSNSSQETVVCVLRACRSFGNPLIYYFAMLVAVFFLIIAGLGVLAALLGNAPNPLAILLLLPPGAAVYWAYRGYTWIRLPNWGEHLMVFSIRREAYARELAAQNRGYIRGRLRSGG